MIAWMKQLLCTAKGGHMGNREFETRNDDYYSNLQGNRVALKLV
jgi:hypothetical protein